MTKRDKERAVAVAEQYRESMLLLGIQRGMEPTEATAFAQRCVVEQLLAKDEIAKREEISRKLKK